MKSQKILLTLLIVSLLWFSTINSVFASEPEYLIERIGSHGTGNGEFDSPTDVIKVDDQYYVCDYQNDRIQVFDKDWNYVDQFGGTGAGLGQLDGPETLYYNGSYIFVTEFFNNRVSVFNPNGSFVAIMGGPDASDGLLSSTMGIAGDGDIIYVSNLGNARIVLFNATTLEYMKYYNPPQISYPSGLFVDDNYIYVSDANAEAIHTMEKSTGAYQFVAVSYDTGAGILRLPFKFEILNDHFIVPDYHTNNIKIYNLKGEFVQEIRADLGGPRAALIDQNKMIISERAYYRISVLQLIANPTNIIVNNGDYGVIVTWDINQNEGATKIMNYNVYRDNGSGLVYLGQTATRSFNDISVKSDQTYTYYVEANSAIATSDLVSSTPVVRVGAGVDVNNDTSSSSDGSFFSNLPINILPVVLVLLLIPIIRVKYRNK